MVIKITESVNMSMESVAIKVSHLSKSFGDLVAVNNNSFDIHKGEIVGILGPNGAGKTTTIRLLTGVFQLNDSAKIEIFGKEISRNSSDYKHNYGIVPEISNAYSGYTVWQNLLFFGGIHGISKSIVEKRAKQLLKQFKLSDKMQSKTKSLSKGLKQRLSLSLALLHDPPILILDEPTSGLDPMSVKLMRAQLLKLKNEGKTILITTHDLKEAQNFCDRILIMNRGKIIANESPKTLREQYKPSSTLLFKFKGDLTPELEKKLSPLMSKQKNGSYSLSSIDPPKDISEIYHISNKNNLLIENLKIQETSLEEVFIDLIQKDQSSLDKTEGVKKQ